MRHPKSDPFGGTAGECAFNVTMDLPGISRLQHLRQVERLPLFDMEHLPDNLAALQGLGVAPRIPELLEVEENGLGSMARRAPGP